MPEVIAKIKLELPIPIRTNPFYIKRYSEPDFHLFRLDWDPFLYQGDQLKVPQGSKVSIKCQHNNGTVDWPDDGIPRPVTRFCSSR